MLSEGMGQGSRQGGVGNGHIRADSLEEAMLGGVGRGGRGERQSGSGEDRAVGWLPGCQHHGGSFSPLPLHPAPYLLPEPLYQVTRWGQGEKGNSYQPTR